MLTQTLSFPASCSILPASKCSLRTARLASRLKRLFLISGFLSALALNADTNVITIGLGTTFIANQLQIGSNTLIDVFGAQLPDNTAVSFWNCPPDDGTNTVQLLTAMTSYTTYVYDTGFSFPPSAPSNSWWNADHSYRINPYQVFLPPGRGAMIQNVLQTYELRLIGTPNVPALPAALPCGCGHFNLLSRQTNDVGTYENIIGRVPVNGAQIITWNGVSFETYTYESGAWTPYGPPYEPYLGLGEPAFFLVPCNTNCITMTSPTDKTVPCDSAWDFDAPSNITYFCCLTNLTDITTVTNGSEPASLVITRTWTIIDSCTNTATCSQTVTLATAANPPTLNCQASGTEFILSWPATHIGWQLLAQTNDIEGSWVPVPGSLTTNQMTLPLSQSEAAVFYRLQRQ